MHIIRGMKSDLSSKGYYEVRCSLNELNVLAMGMKSLGMEITMLDRSTTYARLDEDFADLVASMQALLEECYQHEITRRAGDGS